MEVICVRYVSFTSLSVICIEDIPKIYRLSIELGSVFFRYTHLDQFLLHDDYVLLNVYYSHLKSK